MLTADQKKDYDQAGCLLVSGLIPPETAAAAEAAMWRLIGASPNDPGSWADLRRGHSSFDSPELLACYTPAYLEAAAQLAGDDPTTYRPPRAAYAINVLPQEGEWTCPAPHIDHAIKEHGHTT